jgi:hypothetical protein
MENSPKCADRGGTDEIEEGLNVASIQILRAKETYNTHKSFGADFHLVAA